MIPLWIVGAGGHAKVVRDAAGASGLFDIKGYLDDRVELLGGLVLRVPILGPISESSIRGFQVEYAVLAIGSNLIRDQLATKLADLVEWATVIHPTATVSQYASLGAGSVVCAGAVIQAGATIGRHVIINTCASVDHDTTVGDYAHIGPGCHLAGDVFVDVGALLGVGSSVAPSRRIGAWSVVGAGGVVTQNVPDYVTVAGVPARPLRK